MKKHMIRLLAVVLCCGMLMGGLCSCMLHKVEYDKTENAYVDGRTGIAYHDAPGCYEPVAIGKEYAQLKYGRKTSVVFYEMGEMDPAKWLCEEGKTVFYADGVTLPTLTEMAPEQVHLCIEQASTMVLSTITDAEDIHALIDVWLNGEEVVYTGLEPNVNLRVKFESASYPGLYYSLIYLEYGDGTKMLYDRFAARCVDAGDVLLEYVG